MGRVKNVLITLFLCTLVSVSHAAQNGNAPAVTVQQVQQTELKDSAHFVGRVEAVAKVELLARVSGFLEKRLFTEGLSVKAGDTLFQIEKATYQIARQQALAEIAGARASLKNAETELRRTRALRKRNAIAQSQVDLKEAERDQAKANVLKAQASLRKADLDLAYTEVKTPLSGRIGKARYSEGNLVGPNSSSLATVVQIDPVYVELSVSEKALIEARRDGMDQENPPVAPRLVLADGSDYEHMGEFNFINPEVDPDTDTIRVRATFPNPEHILLPGQFVNVRLTTKEPQIVVAVPQAAVQKDREGYFVLTVDRDNKVEMRRIKVGAQFDGMWQVEHGLVRGERIITEGLQKARPGALVNPQEG